MSDEQTARIKAEIADITSTYYVLNTADGRHIAFNTRRTASKYKGTIGVIEVRMIEFLRTARRIRVGRANAWLV